MGRAEQSIIIFDGVCNLCEYSLQLIVQHDNQSKFHFVSGQSAQGKALQQMCGVDVLLDGTVILLKDDRAIYKNINTTYLLKRLPSSRLTRDKMKF